MVENLVQDMCSWISYSRHLMDELFTAQYNTADRCIITGGGMDETA